jgi:hypothetical protein
MQGEHLRNVAGDGKEFSVAVFNVGKADPLIEAGVERSQMRGNERIVPEGVGADDFGWDRSAEALPARGKPAELAPR